ncbi:GNAT family N-acetyltransferase [Shewanella sp. CG12_big_fil_rev_8_21_14_0_65_47_15]|uniref:GNAT family N-acetyltransferase n=1 Tax=Shewanella sp. CG12_big_fil_rev_8_21_14_0_65_47_15 TaxID=1975537 RepID=UPI000CB16AAF|nr:GNAT family N-acetyltransferase [Shewanella sp. CG12_big_fil_rev_8_21_14_0_65_47_15]PIW61785.1 MAG: GNAT family N-acetyltransferase [Shewanella sp. CG12_big_fil_rev_8_21_14_0_65_47_15]
MEYRVSTEQSEMDFEVIHDFISNSYWAQGMPPELLRKALSNNLCFGVFDENNQQLAFTRMITDKATFGYLADVFVLESHRGLGLSKLMMTSIMEHPDLQGLRRIMLATRDAHGLYAQFGFNAVDTPETLMQIRLENPYVELSIFS